MDNPIVEKTILIMSFVIMALGLIGMYTPRYHLMKKERLQGKELSLRFPQYTWIRWMFFPLFIAVFALDFLLFMTCPWKNVITAIGVLFSSIGLYYGFFAFFTNVYILPTKSPRLFFVIDEDVRKASRFQIIWNLLVIFFALILELNMVN